MKSSLFWFRRDLRLNDNAGLYYALENARQVHCVFIFDRDILDALPSKSDRRVDFIREALDELDSALRQHGGELTVRHAKAVDEIPKLAGELGVDAVFANEDYEPAAILRDRRVAAALKLSGIDFLSFNLETAVESDGLYAQPAAHDRCQLSDQGFAD